VSHLKDKLGEGKRTRKIEAAQRISWMK